MKELLTMHYAPRDQLPTDFELLYSEKEIELAYGSLISFRDNTLRMLYLSRKEFLVKSPDRTSLQNKATKFLVDVSRANSMMTTACLFYLHWKSTTNAFDAMRKPPSDARVLTMRDQRALSADELRNQFPLVEYAVFHFTWHFIDSKGHERECCCSISPWVSSALMCLWMEICFVFDEKFPGGVLGIQLEIVRDILLDFKDGEVQKLLIWIKTGLGILDQYCDVLWFEPFSIGSIDPSSFFPDSPELREYIRIRNSNR
jgi:hypothetical protein